jgi:hypothetical protein
MGDAIPAEDDRGNASDDSEKKRGCDGVFHGGPHSGNPRTSCATLIDHFHPNGAGRLS